jgi:ABC-type oligopeptide transport system substrate-binding subunit
MLLREAGHPGGRDLPELRIAWRSWDKGFGARFAASLRRLGLRVRVTFYDDQEYEDAIETGDADLFRAGWIADYPDPQTFLRLFYSKAPENLGSYVNPQFDELFERFRSELDTNARLSLARGMEEILIEETAAIFSHHERVGEFVSSRVQDWAPYCTNPLNVCFYEHVKVRSVE